MWKSRIQDGAPLLNRWISAQFKWYWRNAWKKYYLFDGISSGRVWSRCLKFIMIIFSWRIIRHTLESSWVEYPCCEVTIVIAKYLCDIFISLNLFLYAQYHFLKLKMHRWQCQQPSPESRLSCCCWRALQPETSATTDILDGSLPVFGMNTGNLGIYYFFLIESSPHFSFNKQIEKKIDYIK